MSKYALVAVAGLAITAGAQAGGFGGFSWDFNDNAGGSGAQDVNQMDVWGGDAGVAGDTSFTTTANFTGDITFDWWYMTSDTGDFDQGFYSVNGQQTAFVINDDAANNGGSISGTNTFSVNSGDTFGFGVLTLDGAFGPAHLTIHSMVPTPGALSLFGIAGLAAIRRRR